jgi:hypothetical protein
MIITAIPFSLKLLLQEAGFEDIQINSMGDGTLR